MFVLSVSLSIYRFVCPFVCLSVCLSIYLYVYLPACLFNVGNVLLYYYSTGRCEKINPAHYFITDESFPRLEEETRLEVLPLYKSYYRPRAPGPGAPTPNTPLRSLCNYTLTVINSGTGPGAGHVPPGQHSGRPDKRPNQITDA